MAKHPKIRGGSVPLFAAIAQPNYVWTEHRSDNMDGTTGFPIDDGFEAAITVPASEADCDTPGGRFVRLHELMHARFTPDILKSKLISKPGDSDGIGRMMADASYMAAQIAEDVRLADIANKADIIPADIYLPADAMTAKNLPFQDPEMIERAMLYKHMASYGSPVENLIDSKSTTAFEALSGYDFRPETKKSLTDWAGKVDAILANDVLGPAERYDALAGATQLALTEVTKTRPLQYGGGDTPGSSGGTDGAVARSIAKVDEAMAEIDEALRREADRNEIRKNIEKAKIDEENATMPLAPDHRKSKNDEIRERHESRTRAINRAGKAIRAEAEAIKAQLLEETNIITRKPENLAEVKWQPAAMRYTAARLISATDAEIAKFVDDFDLMMFMQKKEASEYKPNTGLLMDSFCVDSLSGGWGEMLIRMAPLERNFKAIVKRRGVPSPDGPIPTFFNRWFSDKHLFQRLGRRLGGTVLLDVSGSMSWSHDMTLALIEATPAMTIAAYSSDKASTDFGRLTIIAKHGRLVSEDFVLHGPEGPFGGGHGGGNVVDGPALAWLAKQAEPRVWLSDGNVTGIGEGQTERLKKDVKRIMAIGKIRRTPHTAEVIRIFGGKPAE